MNLKNRRGGRGRKSKADNPEVGTLILRFAKRYVLCGQGWLPLSPHQLAVARPPVDYSPSTRYSDAELTGTTLLSPQQLDNRTQGVIWELHSLLPEGLEEEDLSKTLFETVCPSFPATCAYPWQVNIHMSDYRSHIQNRLRTNSGHFFMVSLPSLITISLDVKTQNIAAQAKLFFIYRDTLSGRMKMDCITR